MNFVKTFMLMAALTALLMLAGQALGGSSGLAFALIMALGMNFFAYWYSDKMALAMSKAREVSPAQAPELHQMVAGLAQRAGLPKPRVYIIPNDTPNAFATGRNPEHSAVAVTNGLLRILSREYLADATAARISGRPEALASALRQLESYNRQRPMKVNPATAQMYIVNPLSASTMANLFSTHPPIRERIKRLTV